MIPAGAVTVSVDVSELVMVVFDREMSRPDGNEVCLKSMLPLKSLIAVTVIVEVHDGPEAATERNAGSAESSKSGPFTITGMSTDCDRELLLPVTVTE